MATGDAVALQNKASFTINPHPPTLPNMKLRLDPQRALEPARKKLSTVEAQRIMASLIVSIKRIELITALPYIIENLDRYRVVIGEQLVQGLENHRVIIESFNELRDSAEKLIEKQQFGISAEERIVQGRQSEASPPPSSPSTSARNSPCRFNSQGGKMSPSEYVEDINNQVDMAMKNLSLVAKQMQFSCRSILRMFTNDPSALNTVLKDQDSNRTPEAIEMIREMNELKDILMGMLLTTPGEEQERGLYLKEISQRERHNAAIIQKLEAELQAALDDKENEIKKKNDVIRRLQADLNQIQKFSKEHIRKTKTDAEKQEAADLKNSEGKRQKLQQEIAQMKTQLQNLIAEHRENEVALRTKKYKIETEVENWIQKYDGDMGERQAEFEEIDAVYTEEKKQLNELEERFKTLEEEYNQIMEERRIARERREAAERELQMSVKAATIIQAFWRSYKVRKALKSKKKKGKKGKKGKK